MFNNQKGVQAIDNTSLISCHPRMLLSGIYCISDGIPDKSIRE